MLKKDTHTHNMSGEIEANNSIKVIFSVEWKELGFKGLGFSCVSIY